MSLRSGLTLTALTTAALIAGCAAPGTTPMATDTAAAPAPPQIPLRDFFRNIDRGYFRVSGDGRTGSSLRCAWTVRVVDHPHTLRYGIRIECCCS